MQPVAMPMPSGAPATQAVVPAQQPGNFIFLAFHAHDMRRV